MRILVVDDEPIVAGLIAEGLRNEGYQEVVIANKVDQEVKFERLADREHLSEILEGVHLSDVWYSGVLGGVPLKP